jgi:hypothetical protein
MENAIPLMAPILNILFNMAVNVISFDPNPKKDTGMTLEINRVKAKVLAKSINESCIFKASATKKAWINKIIKARKDNATGSNNLIFISRLKNL